jgi:hypothetical protein
VSFFLAGGFPMVFVLVFGGVAIASAGRFAMQPVAGGARSIVAYGAAVAFTSIAGLAVDLAAVGYNVVEHPEWAAEAGGIGAVALMGLGEALSPVILGFALLAVTSLLTAVGLRRLPEA